MTDEEKKVADEAAAKAEFDKAAEAGKTAEPTLEEAAQSDKPLSDDGIAKLLADEETKINTEIDKGEPGKKEVKENKAAPEELIDDEYRKQYNVPEKIKTHKAYADWAANAEKIAFQEKADLQKRLKELEDNKVQERIDKLQATIDAMAKPKTVEDTEADKEKAAVLREKIKILMDPNNIEMYDPVKAMELRDEAIKEQTVKKQQDDNLAAFQAKKAQAEKDQRAQFDIESAALLKEHEGRGEKDKYLNEIFPELAKISVERDAIGKPLHFIGDAYAIYLQRRAVSDAKSKAEDDAKRKEKEALAGESSRAGQPSSKELDFSTATTEAELEAMAKKAGI